MQSGRPHYQRIYAALTALLIIPASASFAQQGLDLPTTFPGITVLTPAQGATVRPGQAVAVKLEIDPALMPGSVFIMGNIFRTGIAFEMEGPPFQGALKIPEELAGPVELGVLVKNKADKMIGGLALNINVVPAEAPKRINAGTHYYLPLPPASFIGARRLSVQGTYDNGVRRDISNPVTGTSYRTSNKKVVTVNDIGVMEPVAPGSAFVIVEHRGLKGFVAVDVESKESKKMATPAQDHTQDVSITASPPRQVTDDEVVRDVVEVTIRNNAELPLHLPLHLVITDLSAGVRVGDASKTSRVKPVGSPYVFVDVDERGYLSPGNSARATISFINLDRKPIKYQLRLYAGGRM